MPDPSKSPDWKDIVARAVIPGVLIAFAGFVGQRTITSINSKAENARLVTTLQIQREQAETDLRRDIFNQAVEAFIDDTTEENDIDGLSQQLLKLELLALNFGDSIRLAPLFIDLEQALTRHLMQVPADSISTNALRDRLWGLASRVASSQLSFLGQRGSSRSIQISLTPKGDKFKNGKDEFRWPEDLFSDLVSDSDVPKETIDEWTLKDGAIALPGDSGDQVFVSAVFQNPDPQRMEVEVGLRICPLAVAPSCVLVPNSEGNEQEKRVQEADVVKKDFTLNYFNFPTIDNSRLPGNDRFAVVLDDFSLGETESLLKITVVIFPSEYASLRDRPTMSESLELLERAQTFDTRKRTTTRPHEDL